MNIYKLADFFMKKYGGKSWEDKPSPYEASPWKKIEGPDDTSLGIPYSAGEVVYYKDQLALLWDKVNGPDKELWDRLFKIADSSLVNLPLIKRFKEVFNDFIARLQKASLKESLILCAEMMGFLSDLREAISVSRTSDMSQQVRMGLDDLVYRIGNRVWERTKKILTIYKMRQGIMNSPEILNLFSAAGKGSWHYGPMASPFRENNPAPQPGDRVPAKFKMVSMIDQNIWEDVDSQLPASGTNEKERTKLFDKLKKEYNTKSKESKK